MRRILLAISVLLGTGCAALRDPVAAYRMAAQQLRIGIDRVHPSLEVRFPLDRSGLKLHLVLGVENPSPTRLPVLGAKGVIWLETTGVRHRIGEAALQKGVALEPMGRGTLGVDLFFAYQDVKNVWDPLRSLLLKSGKGTWQMEGMLTVEVLGIPLEIPFKASRAQETTP